MQRTAHKINQFFADYDVMLSPTLAQPPAKLGTMLPTGAEAMALQVIGRFADEVTLLRLAAQLEQAKPWANEIPPLV